MRQATVRMRVEGGFHPADRLLAADPAIRRGAIDYIDLLADGTTVLLYRLSGDLDRARALLTDCEAVLTHDVVDSDEGLLYLHTRASPLTEAFLLLPREYGVVVETPIAFVSGEGVRLTLAGTQRALGRMLAAVPAEIEVSLERTTEYRPGSRDLASLLTDRQREVLTVAVKRGYFEALVGGFESFSRCCLGEHAR